MVPDETVQAADTTTGNDTNTTAAAVDEKTTLETDIAKLDAQIATFEADGSEVFLAAKKLLEDQKAEAVAKLAALEAEAKTAMNDVEAETETFWSKNKGTINNICKYALLIIIAGLLVFDKL